MSGDFMKCTDLKPLVNWASSRPFEGIGQYLTSDWQLEPKLDGVRMRMILGDAGNKLTTGLMNVSANFPHIAQAVMPGVGGTVIDGELVALDPQSGRPRLGVATGLANSRPSRAQMTQRLSAPARLYVFDVLSVGPRTIEGFAYEDRAAILTQITDAMTDAYPGCQVIRVPQYPATAKKITKLVADGFEGVVLKRKDSTYVPATRSQLWLKLKAISTADGFVTGSRPGEGGNSGLVGSFEISLMFADGPVPVGHVGNFTRKFRKQVSLPDGSLDPQMYGKVVEFSGQCVSKDGKIRHPLLVRLRPDKIPEDCLAADQLEVFPRA